MADGYITVDTKIDPEGFTEGLAKLRNLAKQGLAAVGASIEAALIDTLIVTLTIVASIAIAVTAIATAFIGAVTAAYGLWKAAEGIITQMVGAMDSTTEYAKQVQHVKDLFDSVKMATYAAFAPLIEFALPYIERIVHALVAVFNAIAVIIAKVLGLATVWQYVEGSTKKATGAAKGALAAFDQLNVLQQQQGENAGAGKFAPGDTETLWQELIAKIRKAWQDFLDWFWNTDLGKVLLKLWAVAVLTWNELVRLWGLFTAWWDLNVTQPLLVAIGIVWDWMKLKITEAWDWLVQTWWGASTWWYEHITKPIIDWITYWANWWGIVIWDMFLVFTLIWIKLSLWWWNNVTWPLIKWWLYWGTTIGLAVLGAWNKVVEIWGKASAWWKTNITDKFMEHIDNFVKHLKYAFGSGFAIAANIVIGFANSIIKAMNTVMSTAAVVWNALIHAANTAGEFIPSWKFIPDLVAPSIKIIPEMQMPKLATGAVIPPNSAFAAILGDQRSGKNIEAPEDLIRQIVREESGQGAGGDITIHFEGTLASFIQSLKPYIDKEDRRVGTSMVLGGIR